MAALHAGVRAGLSQGATAPSRKRFDEAEGVPTSFVQDNHSRSSRGVLRGLHYQLEPEPQAKLVRCTVGAVSDVNQVDGLRQSG